MTDTELMTGRTGRLYQKQDDKEKFWKFVDRMLPLFEAKTGRKPAVLWVNAINKPELEGDQTYKGCMVIAVEYVLPNCVAIFYAESSDEPNA